MFNFRAYFWGNDVYINEKYRYDANEILTAYLNVSHAKKVLKADFVGKLKEFKRRLTISPYMDYYDFSEYNKNVYSAMSVLEEINQIISSLPPFDKILNHPLTKLDDILNSFDLFFEDGLQPTDYSHGIVDENFANEYGYGEKDDCENYYLRLIRFDLKPLKESDLEDNYVGEELREANRNISAFFDIYIKFLHAYTQVQQIYKPFICDYLHRKNAFLTASETAQCFEQFNHDKGKNFSRVKCKMESFGYRAITDKNGEQILCEEIKFNDLGSFLYYDFFNGLKQNYIPNLCKNCGKFFLIRGAWYYTYCDNPLVDEPEKTCRDVGSKRRYDEKCKNNPVWQTYNRAYKAHYARYMKKKMTVSEFEEWSRFASEIRDKALAGEVPYEQYYADIRK